MNETTHRPADGRDRFLVELDEVTRPLEAPDDITRTMAAMLASYLNVDRAAYADVDPDANALDVLGNYGGGMESTADGRLSLRQFGVEFERAMREGEPFVVHDSETDSRTQDSKEAYRNTCMRAMIAVPLLRRGRLVAVMAVHQASPRTWQEGEIETVRLVASRGWESLERARVTRELRASERRLRLAQRAGRIGSFEWDITSGQVCWSDEIERLYGLEPGSFEGNIASWCERLLPEDNERVAAEFREAMAQHRTQHDYEFRAILPDGRLRWLRGQAQFEYAPDGRAVRMIGVNMDIDERKRALEALGDSEARFRGLVQATPDCVTIVALDGTLQYMNRAGQRMFECECQSAPERLNVFSFVAPEYREEFIRNHRRVCAGEQLSWEFEIVGLAGTRRWMETHAVPLATPGEQPAQLAVTRNIDGRKKAEAERERLLQAERIARASAERASLLKDEFLATLSHELRTPLNAILGWTYVLRARGVQSEAQREALDVIERNARAQAQIVDDLLDMNRIISGRIYLEVQPTDAGMLLSEAIDSLRPAADAKGIILECEIAPGAGPMFGDPGRLRQVIWNLVSNAIKFTPRGGRVRAELHRTDAHLELKVTDTGEGISPQFLPHVFDRFRQADASTTRRHGGLGLGLAIARQLVELHGGSIEASSAGPDAGATFTVVLPVYAPAHAGTPTPDTAAQRFTKTDANRRAGAINLHGVRALVVEDEPDTLNLLRHLLQDGGAQVTTASSAAEALQHLSDRRFDVIVSDLAMPGEDGYSLLRRVRESDPGGNANVPALALTAYARSDDRVRATRAGFQLYLTKPVDAEELITMIGSLTGRARE